MRRIAGIAAILIAVMLVTAIISPTFLIPYNLKNILRWTGSVSYTHLTLPTN